MQKPLPILVFVLFALLLETAVAQTESSFDEFSLHLGWLLPNQIDGVTEMLPVWGLGYAMGTGVGGLDLSFYNSTASGVQFTTLALSLRGEIPIDEALLGLIYGGADVNIYQPTTSASRITETGLHVGVGGMMFLAESFWVRSDLRFMAGPGTSLYLGFGAVLRAK